MTYDRAAILRTAWAWARQEPGWSVAYDWTPGPSYGAQRKPTVAERRAIFAECLRRAWGAAKAAAAYAAKPARPKAAVLFDLTALDGKNRWTPADYAHRAALSLELRAAVAA